MSIATTLGSQVVPPYMADEKEHRRQLSVAVNSTKRGKINATLDVTLNPSSTTTIIQDPRINSDSAITPAMAMTSSGATAMINGIYVDTIIPPVGVTLASATIHHASNASTTQTIRFLILG